METGFNPRPDGAGTVRTPATPAVVLGLRRRRRFAGAAAVASFSALTLWLLVSAPRDVPSPSEQAAAAVLWGQWKLPDDAAKGPGEGKGRAENAPPGDAVVAPPPPIFNDRPDPPVPPPAQLWTADPAEADDDGVWAVVIGINNYPGSKSDLRSAVNDATDVQEALLDFGVPESRLMVLRDEQASANMILTAADWLVSHAGKRSKVVFFYAGHVRKVAKNTEVIVAADGTTVSDVELARHLVGLRAEQTWIGLAACYSGGFTELLGDGRVLTAATDANNLAYENLEFKRSYLVQYMVREAFLQGKADTSIQDAFAHAKKALEKAYPNRVPVQYDEAGGPLDLRSPRNR
jgi:hypothetical protein